MITASGQTSLTGAAASSTSVASSNIRAATTGSITGAIVGGVIGGIVLIVLVIGAMYYVYRRGRRSGFAGSGRGRYWRAEGGGYNTAQWKAGAG